MFVIDVANEDAKKNLELLYECFDKYAKDYFTVEWDKTTGDDGVETDDAEHESFTCKIDGKDFLTFLQIQDTGAKNIIKFVGKTNETFFLTPYNSLGYMKCGILLMEITLPLLQQVFQFLITRQLQYTQCTNSLQ